MELCRNPTQFTLTRSSHEAWHGRSVRHCCNVQVGFTKTVLSRGKYAELLSDNRGFTEQEEALFDEAAEFAYRSFRDKAAQSRGMEPEELEQFAQGRVWLGRDAIGNGCVPLHTVSSSLLC
jgi:hypothetical protein